jgi:hypothetical protein
MQEAVFKYIDYLSQRTIVDYYLERRLVRHTEWADKFSREDYFDFWEKHHDPLEILEKDKIILVLGEAGSGKTTLLNQISSRTAKSCLDTLPTKDNILFPIQLSLNQFEKEGLLDYLQKKLPPDVFSLIIRRPEGYKNWRFIYLLDGLDEIPLNGSTERLQSIVSKSIGFKNNSDLIFLSSRPIFYESYKSIFDLWPIQVYHLAPLTWEQISCYCTQNGCDAEFLLKESLRLEFEDLLRNPLNLTFIVDLLKTEGQLPSTKADLFEKIVQGKISQRHVKPFERKGLLEGQRDLAIVMEMLQRNYLSVPEAARVLHEVTGVVPSLPEELIEEIDIAGLIVRSEDVIRFEHRTMGEYLASTRLRNENILILRELLCVGQNRLNPSWANTASFLLEINAPFKQYCSKEIPSACISASPEAFSPEEKDIIFNSLYDEFNIKNPFFLYSNPSFLRRLAHFIPDKKIGEILSDIDSENIFRRSNAVALSIFIKDKANAPKLRSIALDPQEDQYVRVPALDALGEIGSFEDIKALYVELPSENNLQIHYIGAIARLVNEDNLTYLLNSLKYNIDLNMSVIRSFKKLKSEKAILKILDFLLTNKNISLLRDNYISSYFEKVFKNIPEAWSESIANKLADFLIAVEKSKRHIEKDLCDIFVSVLKSKDHEGIVILRIFRTALQEKMKLDYTHSIIGAAMLPSHASWLAANTSPDDPGFKVTLAHDAYLQNNQYKDEIHQLLLPVTGGILEAQEETRGRYAEKYAREEKERKKKEWRVQEALQSENNIQKIIRIIKETDPAVWPGISTERSKNLTKMVEKQLSDSHPQKHMNIVSQNQVTCNNLLYESARLSLKLIDHYDLKLENPSILIDHLFCGYSEQIDPITRYFRRNNIDLGVKEKFKEAFSPDLPSIALNGYLDFLYQFPNQFDISETLIKIASDRAREQSERSYALRLLKKNPPSNVADILKELSKDTDITISNLARRYLIEMQDLAEISRFFTHVLNETIPLPTEDDWFREETEISPISSITNGHPQVLQGMGKIIDFAIEKENHILLEMALNSLKGIDEEKAIEEIDKRIASQHHKFKQQMHRIRELINQEILLNSGRLQSIDVAIKKICQIKSPKMVVIYCEGDTDTPVLNKFIELYRAEESLSSEVEIIIEYMNGWPNVITRKGRYNEWIRTKPKDLIIILDRDPGYFRGNEPSPVVEDILREWQLLGIKYHILDRAGIELYFPKKFIEEVHELQLPAEYKIDIKVPLYKQLEDLKKQSKLKGKLLSQVKFKRKNEQIAKRLQVEDIEGTDLEDFFIHDLKQLIDSIV